LKKKSKILKEKGKKKRGQSEKKKWKSNPLTSQKRCLGKVAGAAEREMTPRRVKAKKR